MEYIYSWLTTSVLYFWVIFHQDPHRGATVRNEDTFSSNIRKTVLVGLSFWNERPYLIKGQKLMILHADFAAENCDYGWKPRIMVENHGLWSKTMDFGQKLQIMVENCGLWSKTADYGKKPQIMVKNCRFQSKTVDFAVSEFKTTKLFISFHSRERIQRVSMFFLFSFLGGFNP